VNFWERVVNHEDVNQFIHIDFPSPYLEYKQNITLFAKIINRWQHRFIAMRGYQPRSNLVKNENGDLLADSHNIVNRWKNYEGRLKSNAHMLVERE
jgi:hypothetical protein